MERIEIPISKAKLLRDVIGSVVLIALSVLLITVDAEDRPYRSPLFLNVSGVIGVIIFGATLIYGIVRMFEMPIGLVIDENGITDYTNAKGIGLVKWSEIYFIQTEKVFSKKIILVFVTDPDAILKKVNGARYRMMAATLKTYGTPLSIRPNVLKCKFEDLEKLLNDYYIKYSKQR